MVHFQFWVLPFLHSVGVSVIWVFSLLSQDFPGGRSTFYRFLYFWISDFLYISYIHICTLLSLDTVIPTWLGGGVVYRHTEEVNGLSIVTKQMTKPRPELRSSDISPTSYLGHNCWAIKSCGYFFTRWLVFIPHTNPLPSPTSHNIATLYSDGCPWGQDIHS